MSIDKSKVKIGSDFEMFLVEEKTNKFISAIPFNNGTKSHPEKLSKDGCCIQRDGVLQECNVPPVSIDEADLFIENVNFVKSFIITTICKERGLKLVCCPSANFEQDQLQDIEAVTFGCDPDFNAWKDAEINEKPECSANSGLRSCGAHIHFSYPDADLDTSIELMKLFDLFITVPFMLIDEDTERRKLYGKAGAFRLQDWGNEKGFEARTLSNIWINTPENIKFVFNQINKMFDYFNEHGTVEINKDADIIVQAINQPNHDLVRALIEKYKLSNVSALLTV